MQLLFRGGLAVALCLGLALFHAAAQGPTPTGDDLTTGVATSDPYYRAWAGKAAAYRLAQQRQMQAERAAREKEEKEDALGGPGIAPPPLASKAEERQKEQNAYFRRLEVCNKLMEVAIQNNDAAMLRQIEQLEAEAFEIYQKRTGLAVTRLRLDDEGADTKRLDSKLGPKSPETGMILPTPPAGSKSKTVASRSEGGKP